MATVTSVFKNINNNGVWSGAGDINDDDTDYASDNPGDGYATYMTFDEFNGASSIHPESTINDISIDIRAYVATSAEYDGTGMKCFINLYNTSASYRKTTADVAEGVATTYTISGSPSYFGIDNDEALELLVEGTRDGYIGAVNSSGDTETMCIEYMEVEVDYTPPPNPDGMIIGNSMG